MPNENPDDAVNDNLTQELIKLNLEKEDFAKKILAFDQEIKQLEEELHRKKEMCTELKETLEKKIKAIKEAEELQKSLKSQLESFTDYSEKSHADESQLREERGYSTQEHDIIDQVCKYIEQSNIAAEFSAQQRNELFKAQIPIAVHETFDNLTEFQKTDAPWIVKRIRVLAPIIASSWKNIDIFAKNPKLLEFLPATVIGLLVAQKMGLQKSGIRLTFEHFQGEHSLEEIIRTRITTPYYTSHYFQVTNIEERVYNFDSHLAAICDLCADKVENKWPIGFEAFKLSLDDRIDFLLESIAAKSANPQFFLNEFLRELLIKQKIFTSGSVEGTIDLSGEAEKICSFPYFENKVVTPKNIKEMKTILTTGLSLALVSNPAIRDIIKMRLT